MSKHEQPPQTFETSEEEIKNPDSNKTDTHDDQVEEPYELSQNYFDHYEHPYYEGGSIITGYDREKMLHGLEVLSNYFEKLSPNEYPQLLLFPDTSARPLYYLVKPLITDIYGRHNLQTPSAIFIKTPDRNLEHLADLDLPGRRAATEEERAELLDFRDIDSKEYDHRDKEKSEAMKEFLRTFRRAMAIAPAVTKEERKKEFQDQVELSRSTFLLRIKEVAAKNLSVSDNSPSRLLVLDDGATAERNSVHMIRKAIRNIRPDITVDAFVFLSPTPGNDPATDVLVGSIDRSTKNRQSKGFDYREAAGVFGSLRTEAAGVDKKFSVDNKYVLRNKELPPNPDDRSGNARINFREELSALGKEFVSKKNLSQLKNKILDN